MKLSLPQPLVFVDLETTGANFANDRIIEVGLVIVSNEGVSEWSSLVNPNMPISKFITGLTGIDQEMLKDAPSFEDIAPTLLEKLKGHLFIAHNARFDYSFLKGEFKRLGIRFRTQNLCSVKLSRKLFPQHHRHSLDALVERHAIEVNDRHRALADAQIIWQLWQVWHRTLSAETIASAIEEILGNTELPPQLDPFLLEDLPEAPGAYALLDSQNKVLQIKRCANLHKQVLSLFAKNKLNSPLARNVNHIDWREAAGELGAKLNERELSLKYGQQEIAEQLCSWKLEKCGEGNFRPKLVFASDLDFATTQDLYGLYQDKRQATQALRKMAEVHHLCLTQIGIGDGKLGEPCFLHIQKKCKGACIGKEPLSLHSARLMTALAKYRIQTWPFTSPIALVERDEFGMLEDFHVIYKGRYIGSAHNQHELEKTLESLEEKPFDPEIYKIINKALVSGKYKIVPFSN